MTRTPSSTRKTVGEIAVKLLNCDIFHELSVNLQSVSHFVLYFVAIFYDVFQIKRGGSKCGVLARLSLFRQIFF